jgi:hypothetical protein
MVMSRRGFPVVLKSWFEDAEAAFMHWAWATGIRETKLNASVRRKNEVRTKAPCVA